MAEPGEPQTAINARDQALYAMYVEEGHPRLRETFVGLLDVLGTTAGTEQRAQQLLEVTHSALLRAERRYADEDTPLVIRWFSDNAAIAAPRYAYANVWGEEGASQLAGAAAIVVAASIQFQLSNLGLFLRGGMDVGSFFVGGQFLYGPPLVCADYLEKHVAVYPRVVLSRNFAAFAREQARQSVQGFPWDVYRELLAVDEDGEVFVDYLRLVGDEHADDDAWLRCHLDHVQSNRKNAETERIRDKYVWAARYHDAFCSEYLAEHRGLLRTLLDDKTSSARLARL